MLRKDFNFALPQGLIASTPLDRRRDSRLMVVDPVQGISHRRFTDLLGYLKQGDLIVFNNTKVIPARLFARKPTGGKVEILVERIKSSHEAVARLRPSKSLKEKAILALGKDHDATVVKKHNGVFELHFSSPVMEVLDLIGHVPLPPYINREDTQLDKSRYQTIYAKHIGAVAAPTAGLHFDQQMLDSIDSIGVDIAFVTLHVGSGTFQPIRTEDIRDHNIHSEWMEVSEQVCEKVIAARARGGRIIAIGTTSARCLETSATSGRIKSFVGETDLFIFPGYIFKAVDMLVTNFHLPESSLMALVSAFSGHQEIMEAYSQAIDKKYRFCSYGDAMLLSGKSSPSLRDEFS